MNKSASGFSLIFIPFHHNNIETIIMEAHNGQKYTIISFGMH